MFTLSRTVVSQELAHDCREKAEEIKKHPYESRFKTVLKGGFRIKFGFNCTDQYLLLKKGNRVVDTIGGTSFGLPYQSLGFVYADFTSSFVWTYKFGGGYPGNPLYFELRNKKNGKNLLPNISALIHVDEKKNLLIYSKNDVPNRGDAFTVLDISNNRERAFVFPDDIFGEAGVCNRLKVKSVSKLRLVIEYEADGKIKTATYRR